MDISNERLQYLKLLKHKYPTERDAAAEMIRLRAVMRLPKGTEHFLSDIHGEHAGLFGQKTAKAHVQRVLMVKAASAAQSDTSINVAHWMLP